MVSSGPGRFEVAALDATAAHLVAGMAEEAWRVLKAPLGLPDAFSSSVFVRLVAADADRSGAPAFSVTVEAGGLVSVRLRVGEVPEEVVRRALVQGLLMRLAVASFGVNAQLSAPLWLEHGCVGWWRTRLDAAQLDAARYQAVSADAPSLERLLRWERGAEEPPAASVGAFWLMTFLQAESRQPGEWPALLRRLLSGEEPLAALAATYPGRYADAGDRELWWKTGYHHAVRHRSLPTLDGSESREQLRLLSRFVFAGANEDQDVVVPLRIVLSQAEQIAVGAEVARRAVEAERLIPALHPFYRNAGLALGEVLRSGAKSPPQRDVVLTAYEADWQDALDLELATTAALNALERSTQTPAVGR